MNIKTTTTLFLLLCSLSFVCCSSDDDAEEEQNTPDIVEDTTSTSYSIPPDNTGMRNLTSVEFTDLMGIGWNVGNSLEAIYLNGDQLSGNETSWGNPVINRQLIDSVKAAGFTTVRIPVSWSHMLADENTFEIKESWLQRVEEVAQYVLDNDMYAIINVHWDGGWMNKPFNENKEEINDKLAVFWEQIAVYFRDYDDHLLFAGTNEVHIQDNYDPPTAENAEVQNSFNQTFVTTVRATGGRNVYRQLIVQSYNTNINHAADHMTLPEDETADRLMVEVHFYDPYEFALEENGSTTLWGSSHNGEAGHADWGDEAWVDQQFEKMKTNFVDKGYGVILGEFGSLLKTEPVNSTYAEHVASRNYYLNYVTSTALENDMVPVYWDNGHTGNLGFGLFDRSNGHQEHAEAIEAIISAGN
ncbi:glycoside hydrolase family 5 protein [Fulvivirga maritima]|uniref:glycoside hydrolase family 5 protein n=1 Tax=Fulvivirga maritima TaxID=2904247 RepID=UPI001F45DE82|nr:glycoside hydrolase family 5 protein [Fulvivirga maritima]UII24605.1 glycoside hydrolase family 5 protein [Fulvivirga maritima]